MNHRVKVDNKPDQEQVQMCQCGQMTQAECDAQANDEFDEELAGLVNDVGYQFLMDGVHTALVGVQTATTPEQFAQLSATALQLVAQATKAYALDIARTISKLGGDLREERDILNQDTDELKAEFLAMLQSVRNDQAAGNNS